MFYNQNYDVIDEACKQLEKENYIADMLVRTLYSNDVDNSECFRIIQLFKEKVLGNVVI